MEPVTISYKGYELTTDKTVMQPERVHQWLSTEAYWSKNIPYELVKRAFDNSFCAGIMKDGAQIGYARLITDYTTFAYLADVYIEEQHRGQGLSKKMIELILDLEWVKGLRRIMLATLDAHKLYEQYGFVRPVLVDRLMEIVRPAIYKRIEN